MVKIVGALSPFFSLDEMTRSQTALRLGLDNTPPAEAIAELRRLCANLLEPARLLLGVPLHVDSGFRCSALNAAKTETQARGCLAE